ncbi:response regulator transcription factor [Magnetospirillum moscoviense]|uniref:DNA-binding response regulator n=1 Tax=Magnetospirillum moscoviense TaxID=1437059 RepID=A0A178MMJ6_9PROT|nr:response regulator transcription factor [Magnetospirillum moscoviense]MBF0325855.1 response regulator transcription factor [Alphaproteobacteria bacterium]OAN49982.1 DNA-binding response regulator [Magnetospirillum moscoviense]
MARIAIVEDETSLRADVVEYLSACGHEALGCGDGRELDAVLADKPVDIVILDVNLPGEDGFSIAKRLRDHSDVGIIMLTARNVGIDRVVGLEIGADVYLVKPVELRELEAQIRTLSRRLKLFPPCAPTVSRTASPSLSGWAYDAVGWTVLAPDGQSVKLTANERVFVSLLVEQPGEPVSRDDIFKALGKRQWDPSDRSVDSMVRRLRAKAQDALGCELPIEAVHGTGYAFAAPIAVI